MTRLLGQVESGRGDFARWLERYADEYEAATGARLYPGTLNVRLEEPWRSPADAAALEVGVRVLLTPCRVGDHAAWILRTAGNEAGRGDHPLEVIELAAAVRLRDVLGVDDGDVVAVDF